AMDAYFHPRSAAVVGASSRPNGRGNGFVAGILAQGFAGPLYPVNPRGGTLMELPFYPDLLSIPGPVDYVISSIPAVGVPELLRHPAGTALLQGRQHRQRPRPERVRLLRVPGR